MDLFLGQTSLKGDFRRYAREFNYVELLAEPQLLPNVKKVATLAGETRGKVQFGVVMSPRVWEAGGDDLVGYFRKVARACEPSWLIVRTPPSVRPGSSSEREVAKRLEEVRAISGNARVAWDARGLWEPAGLRRAAQALGVTPVWDGLSLPTTSLGEEVSYVRFADLGVGGRVNEGRLERLAVKAQDCSALYVVVEGRGAQRTRQILTGIFSDPLSGLEDGDFAPPEADGAEDDVEEDDDDLDDDDVDPEALQDGDE